MKKLLLTLIALFTFGFAFSQCTDLFISEYVEGWNNNKGVEIYNPTNATIDLSNYRLIRWSNGADDSDADTRYVFDLSGNIAAFDVAVIIQDTIFPGNDTMIYAGLKSKATLLAPADYNASSGGSRVLFWNGDDAISLQKTDGSTWSDIDIFGEIGVRPLNFQGTTSPVGAWDHDAPHADGQGTYLTKDHNLVRKSTVTDGIDLTEMNAYGINSFDALAEYDSLPNHTFDNLGIHTCDCYVGIDEVSISEKVEIFPNPATDQITVKSNKNIKSIEVLNLIGQTVIEISNDYNTSEIIINLSGNEAGLYFVKVNYEKSAVLRKLILK